jgi:hypothetical protein
MKQYYVYILYDPFTEKPFYVGKGSGDRMKSHWLPGTLSQETNMKSNKIRQILAKNLEPIAKQVFISESEEECFTKEIELITLYGRRDNKTGILCNMTDGGRGTPGVLVSESKREKSRIQNTGKVVTENTREKLRISSTGRVKSPETIQKLVDIKQQQIKDGTLPSYRQSHKDAVRVWSINHHANMSIEQRSKISKKCSDSLMGHEVSVETRKKLSKTLKDKNLKPWQNFRIKNNPTILSIWQKADEIYNFWNNYKYKSSDALAVALPQYPKNSLRTIVKHFKQGWIPQNDSQFLEFKLLKIGST